MNVDGTPPVGVSLKLYRRLNLRSAGQVIVSETWLAVGGVVILPLLIACCFGARPCQWLGRGLTARAEGAGRWGVCLELAAGVGVKPAA